MAGGSLGEQQGCTRDKWVWDETPLCKPKGYQPEFYEPHSKLADLKPWAYGALALLVFWLLVRAYEAYKR